MVSSPAHALFRATNGLTENFNGAIIEPEEKNCFADDVSIFAEDFAVDSLFSLVVPLCAGVQFKLNRRNYQTIENTESVLRPK